MGVPPEVESLIADAPLTAHLATSVDDRPHVAGVWYAYEDGRLLVLTGGRKLRNVRENPRVAVSIEDADGPDVHWSATLLGTARVVTDTDRVQAARDAILPKYESDADPDGEANADEGGNADEETDTDDETDADGEGNADEETDADEETGALVEIEVASATATRY